MIKVFLAEDEFIIRDAIKKSIDWKKEGYEFVGEASDGELAYPMIMKEKPDILITDIKMPFMDGLELGEIVKKELPETKILILSGYNDFDFAQKAIEIGITDYLLKPISAERLLEAIGNVSKQIMREREEKQLLLRYSQETQENKERERQNFINKILSEDMSMREVLKQGEELGLNLSAQMYNVMLFQIYEDAREDKREETMEVYGQIETLMRQMSGVYIFRNGIRGWIFLYMANDEEEIKSQIEKVKEKIQQLLADTEISYFGGIGKIVSRLRELKQSYWDAEKAIASRFTREGNQIISLEDMEVREKDEDLEIENLGAIKKERELMEVFLKNGTQEEVEGFVENFLSGIPEDNLRSYIMRHYLLMDTYIQIFSFGESLGIDKKENEKICGTLSEIAKKSESIQTLGQMKSYVTQTLKQMLQERDTISRKRYTNLIEEAKAYIAKNYMSEDISLKSTAASVNMSVSYFSSIFSQEVGKTFVEYLTETRMEKAKELLMCSSKRTFEIGYEVGYKDSHYFSFIFKKTQGCSPKEYRMRGRKND